MGDAKSEAADEFDPNGPHRCKDFDEDCFGLNHRNCWLLDPTQGICPFLQHEEAGRAALREREG